MSSVSVIIVTYNSQKFMPKTIDCLLTQTVPPEKIIIVDSGSHDTSYLDIYKKEAHVKVILENSDVGFCRGNNIGMTKVRKECQFVFFLNPDAFLTPKFIEEAIAYMESNPRCGMMTGMVLGYDIGTDKPTGKYDSTGIFRTWYGRWYDRDQGQDCDPIKYQNVETVPAICGAVMFCRKKALDDVLIRHGEVFDNAFYMYKEDIDLSLRLRNKGWTLDLVPHLIVYHCRGWNKNRSQMQRKFRMHSAVNEVRIQARSIHPLGMMYALAKYTAVKVFDK